MDRERKRQLKQAVRNQERQRFLDSAPLAPHQLDDLLNELDARMSERACDHSLEQTKRVLTDLGISSEAVIPWLRENGGYCDCEVLANIDDPLEDAKKLIE